MINLFPEFAPDRPKRVLLVGAHSDDIEIGCGATLLRLRQELSSLKVHWLVLGANGLRAGEAKASARDFLTGVDDCSVEVFDHRDGQFPAQFSQIKQRFEDLKVQFSPDLIFTHHRDDRHQDHRVVSELTWNTFRNHLILEYEVPKFDGGLGDPNVFVPLNKAQCDEKVRLLTKHFASQRTKQWFDAELFNGLMRLRGLEGATPDGYAEAFHCRKWTFAWRQP
jgi:LmbE family N-acetylglucosaminyl deacetylase